METARPRAHLNRRTITGVIVPCDDASDLGPERALLPIGGVPMIRWVAERLAQAVDRIVVVTRDWSATTDSLRAVAGLAIPVNAVAVLRPGPLVVASVQTGLIVADRIVVVSGDRPLVNPTLLRALAAKLDGAAAVAVAVDGAPLLTLAAYRRGCIPVLEQLAREHAPPATLFERVPSITLTDAALAALDPDGASWRAARTLDDLAAIGTRAAPPPFAA
ncbi:MAG: NTP transferase domain-containing protein [Dehalococcoidia bacterium]|nr:NTP transferase domain-containing protein [Dehalococcoidia bacterium]